TFPQGSTRLAAQAVAARSCRAAAVRRLRFAFTGLSLVEDPAGSRPDDGRDEPLAAPRPTTWTPDNDLRNGPAPPRPPRPRLPARQRLQLAGRAARRWRRECTARHPRRAAPHRPRRSAVRVHTG